MSGKESPKPTPKLPEAPAVLGGTTRLKKRTLNADQLAAPSYRGFLNHLESEAAKEQAEESTNNTSGKPKP